MYDDLDALPGLLPGLYRGVPLHIVETTSDVGRRVLEYLFPGVDAPAYDDFGLLPDLVDIEAIVVGDDYVEQAERLRSAFTTPGPGTLIHPWLGPMDVMLDTAAQIGFSSRSLRVARISATFKRVVAAGAGSSWTGSGLSGGAASLDAAASALPAAVDARVISAVRTSSVRRSARVLSGVMGSLSTPVGASTLAPLIRAALAAPAPDTPALYDTWAAAIMSPLGEMPVVAAVAAAHGAPALTAPSSRSLATIAMSVSQALSGQAGASPSDADRALMVSAAAHGLAQFARQASRAEFVSRRDAMDLRDQAAASTEALIDSAAPLMAGVYQGEASAVVRAARSVLAAVVADIHEIIGRLPAVISFALSQPADAWQVALHVAGDTPARIEDAYRDIVERNDPRHPAAIDAAAIEVLDPR